MTLTALAPDDPALRTALIEAGLPTDDLTEDGAVYFLWSGEGGQAFAGLVTFGDDALLRSVTTPESARGKGLGRAIVDAVAAAATAAGVRRLWLLTTNATPFFAAQGWIAVERASAPAAISATRQFAGLCPASATLMLRRLA